MDFFLKKIFVGIGSKWYMYVDINFVIMDMFFILFCFDVEKK